MRDAHSRHDFMKSWLSCEQKPIAGSSGIVCRHRAAQLGSLLRAMCALQELPGMRVISEKLHNPHSSQGYEEHGLFLFPNTDAGWLGTVSHPFHSNTCLVMMC